jgi:PAS domain S-box-containing protein
MLREASFFRLLADNSPLFIGMCDMKYAPFYVNEAGRRLVGLDDLEHFTEAPVEEFFFPEDRDFVRREFFPRVLEEGRAQTEIRFRHFRTGEAIWMTYDVFVLKTEDGNPVGLATVSREIGERKRAEEALQWHARRSELLSETAARLLESEDPQRLAEDLCRQVMAFLDCDVFFNFLVDEGSARLQLNAYAGIPETEARRIKWLTYGVAVCGCVARDGQPILVENVQQSSDPRVALVKSYGIQAYCCHPLLSEGRVIGTLSFGARSRARFGGEEIVVMKEVSNLVAIAMGRIETEKALREADRRKDEFLATLAHELRNPLAPIRNGLSVLQSGVDGARGERVCAMMARQVHHLVRLVDDLLEVSRISRGRIELQKEWVNLADVVNDALAATEPLVSSFDHRLKVSLPPEPLQLMADPTRLTQILTNLIKNAAKFTKPGGSIQVSAVREGDEVVMSVRDDGVGIAADMLTHVFELFTQIDAGLDRPSCGLGIGLALVRSLVELHGGQVEANSEGVGRGSEFVVRLPLADSCTPRAATAKALGTATVGSA